MSRPRHHLCYRHYPSRVPPPFYRQQPPSFGSQFAQSSSGPPFHHIDFQFRCIENDCFVDFKLAENDFFVDFKLPDSRLKKTITFCASRSIYCILYCPIYIFYSNLVAIFPHRRYIPFRLIYIILTFRGLPAWILLQCAGISCPFPISLSYPTGNVTRPGPADRLFHRRAPMIFVAIFHSHYFCTSSNYLIP